MNRAGLIALAGAASLAAGAAQAQQICCTPQYAPPQYQPRPDGLRGYAQPEYPDRPSSNGLRGYVGVEYGKARENPGSPSPRTETWTGEAAVSGQLGRLGVQGDIKVADFDNTANDGTSVAPTAHVFTRNPYGLIGGWAGWAHSGGADLLGIGAEGQAYLSGATLYGAVGYGHVDDVTNQNLWTAQVEGRYFVTENFRISANAGLVRSKAAGAKSTVRTVGFGAEFQPGNLPFSVQGSYMHADASNSSAEADILRIGMRWNFDGGSLAERDRLGPSLNNVTDLFQMN
jgi:hypothetical protein